jgi:hypothetical protein
MSTRVYDYWRILAVDATFCFASLGVACRDLNGQLMYEEGLVSTVLNIICLSLAYPDVS